ncbi:MAG TPA: RHS repeat-associated core domain-containing protein [Solirubrobacteraceae bacterium]|jgi:RHS repeat-associated protein|nr:RHS repeat-associated core domain-containing protein [Solirubrobacteraceae bacterium]
MKALRLLSICVVSCLAGVLGCAGAAVAGESTLMGTGIGFGGSPLVVPGAQLLVGPQQTQAVEEVLRSSPEAFTAREASRTSFTDLSAGAAETLAGNAFPQLIRRPAGRLPASSGEQIVSYPTDNSAQVDLPGGKHGVIESLEPLAIETSPDHRLPLDLMPVRSGEGFKPARFLADVDIPNRLDRGIVLPRSGVSLRPVDANGTPLSGSPAMVDGATIMYASTQRDADTLVKPLTDGFEVNTVLRSQYSPTQLRFRLDLPAGDSARINRGSIQVTGRGDVIATVPAPTAVDAAGTDVPVSMKLEGKTLVLDVSASPGEYQYPIVVDPTINEAGEIEHKILFGKTWGFFTENPAVFVGNEFEFTHGEWGVKDVVAKSVKAAERAFFYYATQGESRIYTATATTSFEGFAGSKMEDVLGIENVHTATAEASKSWIENYAAPEEKLCVLAGCATGTVNSSNNKSEVFYTQAARETNEFAGGTAKMFSATIGILQEAGPTASFTPIEHWVRPNSFKTGVTLNATDPGLGVYSVGISAPNTPSWKPSYFNPFYECKGVQCNECYSEGCGAGAIGAGLEGLPDGEDVIEGKAKDPVGLSATTKTTVKIDNAAPYNIAISGLPPYNEIGYGSYKVQVKATDGVSGTPSSGVASMTLSIDGKEVGTPRGLCSPGPCTATAEWTISGGEYAAGKHAITMTATDGAGNKATAESSLTFHAAEQQPVGPGSIEPASGAFKSTATDVSIVAPGGGLSVERGYQSRRQASALEGPFGRQWQGLSFGGNEDLTVLPTGSVVLTSSSGAQALFTKEGSKFVPPTGDTSLTLTEESSSKFKLVDQAGNTTVFTTPTGGSGSVLTPASREAVGRVGAVTKYTFQTVSGITEPTEALAPPPPGVNCTTLVMGCRALTFNYASTTTATGEAPSEWGDYNGHITHVYLNAYNPVAKEMQTTAVAQYAYDKQGRLRAEWDPRISPALKTTYGYDGEGHVTAISPPGQQPWLLHYGTIEGDASPGRLLSVTRPAASTALGEGVAPASSEVPKLSTGSPVQGTEATVSTGSWTHSPLSYGYQWEQCNSSGGACEPIAGAVNPGYTPRYSDEGKTLKAVVTATNSGGTASVETAASSVVPYKVFPPVYSLSFGESGTGNGQFNDPQYVAVTKHETSEEVLVTDRYNNRVQAFLASNGSYKRKFGTVGTGTGQFKEPTGIASDNEKQKYLWVADSGNKRLQFYWNDGEIYKGATTANATGKLSGIGVGETHFTQYLTNTGANTLEGFETQETTPRYFGSFGSEGTGAGQFKQPNAITWGPASGSAAYVADTGNNRVQKQELPFNVHLGEFGGAGTGPGQFKGPKGIVYVAGIGVWVVDTGNDRVELFCTENGNASCPAGENKYAAQFGEPPAPAANKEEEKKYEECLAAEKSPQECAKLYPKGVPKAGAGQMNLPVGIAADSAGNLYVVDAGDNRVEKWTAGKRPATPPLPAATPPNPGTSAVWTIEYKVPVSGSGAPQQLTTAEVAKWGQADDPVEATAVFPPDEPMGWPAKDYRRATVNYRDSKDRTVNVAIPDGGISTIEYNAANDVVRSLSSDNRVASLKEGAKSAEDSEKLDVRSEYNSEGTELLSTLGPRHTVELANGKEVQARPHTAYSYDEGAPVEGSPYRQVTKVTQGAQIEGEAEQDVRTTTTSYSGQENLGWKLRRPTSITTDPSGLKLTQTILYDPTTGNVTETRTPASKGASEAHDTKTIYYTTAANSEYPGCGSHAEWANLPCETKPAAQPGTAGLPELPITTTTYNTLDEPETTTQTVGSTTRTAKSTYDSAGRALTSSVSSTVGTALPTVTYEYNTETGAVLKASTTVEGKTQSVSNVENKLGQTTSYTDATGNVSTFEYEPERDGRLTKINDGKGTQTYSYDPTTGMLTKLVDSAAGTFTASYDTEGNLIGEGYPNGMSGNYGYNAAGEALSLEYVKTTHCTEKCTWYNEARMPSIHGQTMYQTNTLASRAYTYDNASRLTQVQETSAGKGCITRVYGYDEDTNRLGLTTREPGTEGKCATEGGTKETHTYDSADRLTDTGAKYETFGNLTNLSAADAGGSELTSVFYTNNKLASQTQKGETIGYQLDPLRRISETVSTGKVVATAVNHYAGSSETPAWVGELSTNWTRNIQGIGVGMAAVQHNGETPVLQLADLKGNIVATAAESETETKLLGTDRTTEYGVPTTEAPPKYSWLGAHELPTELPSGVVAMGARSYVPELGRFLQTDPRPGGSANAYAYTYGDPVDSTDLSGEYTVGGPSQALIDSSAQGASEAAAEQAAINAAARAEAERKAEEAAGVEGGEEWEEEWGEEWEEEEEWEYASYHSQAKNGHGEVRLEGALTSEPFAEAGNGEGEHGGESSEISTQLCDAASSGPCTLPVAKKKKKKAQFHKWIPSCPSGEAFDEFSHKCEKPGPKESEAERIWQEVGERVSESGNGQDHGGGVDEAPDDSDDNPR